MGTFLQQHGMAAAAARDGDHKAFLLAYVFVIQETHSSYVCYVRVFFSSFLLLCVSVCVCVCACVCVCVVVVVAYLLVHTPGQKGAVMP